MIVSQIGLRPSRMAALPALAMMLAVATDARAEAAKSGVPGEFMWIMLFVVALVFLICAPIGGWFIYTGRKAGAQAQASQKWPTVQGKVLESRVQDIRRRTGRGGSTTSYKPVVRYEYTVSGTRYESDVIQFGMIEQASVAKADAFVVDRPAGAACMVHYDPTDPKAATLETSDKSARQRVFSGWLMATVVPAAVALLLGIILLFVA